MPDVCEKNGKDPLATELLNRMATYGKVEPYEKVIDVVTAEYQEALGNTRAQLIAIKEQELTEDEIVFLNFYRERKAELGAAFGAEITELKQMLKDIRDKYKKRLTQISALVDDEEEFVEG